MAIKGNRVLTPLLAVATFLGGILLTNNYTYKGELVTEVVDGDTFFIENNQPIRLYGINAPELGFCYSRESKEKLTKLILDKRVYLTQPLADKLGRFLSVVYSGGRAINEEMIRGGYAAYKHGSGAIHPELITAGEVARAKKLGIYSKDCSPMTPPNPKCTIKGNMDDREGRKLYFRPDCPNYDQVIIERFMGEDYFCSESEAKEAGYVASGTCR